MGVLFSHEPSTGAPYLVINYDDHSERTDTVTSGCTNALRTRLIHRQTTHTGDFADLLTALQELESLTAKIPLDVEFARRSTRPALHLTSASSGLSAA